MGGKYDYLQQKINNEKLYQELKIKSNEVRIQQDTKESK